VRWRGAYLPSPSHLSIGSTRPDAIDIQDVSRETCTSANGRNSIPGGISSRFFQILANILFCNIALRVSFLNIDRFDQEVQVNFLVLILRLCNDDNKTEMQRFRYIRTNSDCYLRVLLLYTISLSTWRNSRPERNRWRIARNLLLISLDTACTAVERIIIKSSYNRKLVSRISMLDSHLVWIFRVLAFRIMNIWLERIETLPHE